MPDCFSFSALRWDKQLARSTSRTMMRMCFINGGLTGSSNTSQYFSRSFCRWVAAAILPQAAVRTVVPAREEAEGQGRGDDMVGFNNQ
jgi:hypothetical protein